VHSYFNIIKRSITLKCLTFYRNLKAWWANFKSEEVFMFRCRNFILILCIFSGVMWNALLLVFDLFLLWFSLGSFMFDCVGWNAGYQGQKDKASTCPEDQYMLIILLHWNSSCVNRWLLVVCWTIGLRLAGIFSSFPFIIFYLIFNRVDCMVYVMLDHFLFLF